MKNEMTIKLISDNNRDMANGMRNNSKIPLTETEIEYIKTEIKRIKANEEVFIFNDKAHIKESTCYNFEDDKIYVTKNVLPDDKYASAHPRDTMSVGAVLAHEYYGHRPFREEYLSDWQKGKDYHTIPLWQDECRASLSAAYEAPGLTDIDKRDLVLDAVYRAKEYGQLIEMNDFMKETLYGYNSDERKFTREFKYPRYVSEKGEERTENNAFHNSGMSAMQKNTRNNDYPER